MQPVSFNRVLCPRRVWRERAKSWLLELKSWGAETQSMSRPTKQEAATHRQQWNRPGSQAALEECSERKSLETRGTERTPWLQSKGEGQEEGALDPTPALGRELGLLHYEGNGPEAGASILEKGSLTLCLHLVFSVYLGHSSTNISPYYILSNTAFFGMKRPGFIEPVPTHALLGSISLFLTVLLQHTSLDMDLYKLETDGRIKFRIAESEDNTILGLPQKTGWCGGCLEAEDPRRRPNQGEDIPVPPPPQGTGQSSM